MKTLQVFFIAVVLGILAFPSQETEAAWPNAPNITFPNVFQVEAECIFPDGKTEVDLALYYDKINNRAAFDIFYQNDKRRQIYDFDNDELLNVENNECSVEKLSDDPQDSFIPSATDEKNNTVIGSPEQIFHFDTKNYLKDDSYGIIPLYIFRSKIKIPKFELDECNITHMFSKPEFTTADCDDRYCEPTLVDIQLDCRSRNVPFKGVCSFFRFEKEIDDDEVFQIPPGVYCDTNSSRHFPTLPTYFSFSYDITERFDKTDSPAAIHDLHKAIWYDGDLQLIRHDEYYDNGLISSTKIFDFTNEVSYSIFPMSSQCGIGPLTPDFTLEQATLLPNIIFPWKFHKITDKPVYAGKRYLHGLTYDVWSVKTESSELRVVKDIYFTKDVSNKPGFVSEYTLKLAFIEIFGYETKGTQEVELTKRTFQSLNHFRSSPRDWSVFDITSCVTDKQKRSFAIKIDGPALEKNTPTYYSLLEQLYLRVITSSGVSVIRLNRLHAATRNDDGYITFIGVIVENPLNLGFGKNNTEPDVDAAFQNIKDDVKRGLFIFNVTKDGKEYKYKAVAVTDAKDAFKEKSPTGYGNGAMAAVAIVMFLIGIIIGTVGLFVYLKKRRQPETQRLVSNS